MIGIVEELVRKRFGDPTVVPAPPFVECRWNDNVETLRCVIYKMSKGAEGNGNGFSILRPVYGDAVGASLFRGTLKLSMLQGSKVFGLYQIKELQDRPEVRHAHDRDPGISYFMDSANVWYYGLKEDQLYVYDSETDELDPLGPVQSAVDHLLTEWEKAMV